MSTTIADNRLPAEITLDDGSQRYQAVCVGPAMRGWLYRCPQAPVWYRVIPISEAPLDWRRDLHRQSVGNSDHLLPAQRDWQELLAGAPHLIIAYTATGPARSLAEILRDADADTRVAAVAACLRSLGEIWRVAPPPQFTMPADVLVRETGEVQLLWTPRGPLPDSSLVLEEPARVFHVAPELLRSATNLAWDSATWEAVERYSLGSCVLSAYCELPAVERAEMAMFRAAGGSLWKSLVSRNDLPPWLERFSDHRNTVALLRRLSSPSPETRMSVDLTQLAERMDQVRGLLDPRTAVAWLRDRTQPKAALDLLHKLFPISKTLNIDRTCQYDLFCMAGELCANYLHRSLEAIDYYERAIQLDPQAQGAGRKQLHVIANARHEQELASLLEASPAAASELDAKLWRNYRSLAGTRTHHASNKEDETLDQLVARYTLWRKQYEDARTFIYPRLFDAQGTYIWWDFSLNLAYVQAFIGLENGDGTNISLAQQQLQQVKDGLNHVRHNQPAIASQVHQYGQEVAELEHVIFQIRHAGQTPSGRSYKS